MGYCYLQHVGLHNFPQTTIKLDLGTKKAEYSTPAPASYLVFPIFCFWFPTEYFDTYDVSEACDGVSNCQNSVDEDPAICSTSTDSEKLQPETKLRMCDQDMTNINYSIVLTVRN